MKTVFEFAFGITMLAMFLYSIIMLAWVVK